MLPCFLFRLIFLVDCFVYFAGCNFFFFCFYRHTFSYKLTFMLKNHTKKKLSHQTEYKKVVGLPNYLDCLWQLIEIIYAISINHVATYRSVCTDISRRRLLFHHVVRTNDVVDICKWTDVTFSEFRRNLLLFFFICNTLQILPTYE